MKKEVFKPAGLELWILRRAYPFQGIFGKKAMAFSADGHWPGRAYFITVKTTRFASENILARPKQSAQITQLRYLVYRPLGLSVAPIAYITFFISSCYQGIFQKFPDVRTD